MTHTCYLGDSKTLTIPLTWEGTPFTPGSDWAGIFTAKFKSTDADIDAAFQHASGGNLSFSGSNAILLIDPADTDTLSPISLICDVQVQHVTTGAIRTVALDRLKLVQDITRETTTSVPPNNTETPMPFGHGIPAGGTIGQVLAKTNGTNFAVSWQDATGSYTAGSGLTLTGTMFSIGTGAVTNAMLANGAVANLYGTNTGDQTLASLGFTAAGEAIAAIGNGTSGYYLKTFGDGTVAWAEVTGGGSNAATATALQTARTISGVSFNGTQNITLTASDVGAAPARIIQTGSFAAAVGGRYTLHNSGAVASITDPSGTAGQSYTVIVGLGTVRFNAAGTTYGVSRVELVRYHTGSAWTTLAPTLADTLTVGTGTWDGATISGPQAFSSPYRPISSATGVPASNSLITLADVDSQLSLRVPESLYLHDRFATGGSSSGTIGELGWVLSGTGAGYNRAGPHGLLTPANTITAALNCAVLGFFAGDYTGSVGIYSRSPVRTFNMIARVSQHYGWTNGKPSSWSMYFAADPNPGSNPNRIIPNNAVGIAAIDLADATWAASTAYSVGNTLAPTTPNGYKYICTTAGTSAAAEPTWPTTFAGTVTNGGAVFTQAGRDGSANFIFFVTGADALSNITVAASSVAILTSASYSTWFDLSIQATATGYSFSVNGETPVTIADTAILLGSPGFAVRNDTSQASVGMLRLRNFGFFGSTRNY